jgi:peptidoglycan-associated lipoprotein
MNFKDCSKFALIAMAAASLLFAGCAQQKKEVAPQPKQTTQAVKSQAAKPSANSVYFAFDSSEIDASSKLLLDGYAAWLNDNSVNTTVEGNCDERGSREYNLALGQRRADSVKDYLVSQGVAASRIDTVSFGEEKPECTGTGEACWAQNRRAEILPR